MIKVIAIALLIFCINNQVSANMFLQNPRGGNNRLNGAGTNVGNGARLFDSQNNAKGGYCWGPTMHFYSGSILNIEWTSSHGCGQKQTKNNCDIIIQYMCGSWVRDGTTRTTIPFEPNNPTPVHDTPDANGEYLYGMHEPFYTYLACSKRSRNKGLFYADQGQGNTPATYTRNRNNNARYGFECPEERDYYPYWHPTPWKDIAVYTSNKPVRCPEILANSQNVKPKNWCYASSSDAEDVMRFNNAGECGDAWVQVDSWGLPAPVCEPAGFNRVNSLSNTIGGYTNTFVWTVPNFDLLKEESYKEDDREGQTGQVAPCVLRVRYNVTAGDFKVQGPDSVDSNSNGGNSPVTNSPYVEFGTNPYESSDNMWYLRLNINTAQFGRVFEDRSHVFYIKKSPVTGVIHNLNVRGKRGNIVQTFPATEYDFVPNVLKVATGEYIHFQWTGCDTNPQGNDGEGRDGTDRSNIVLMRGNNHGANYPESLEKSSMLGEAKSFEAQELHFKFCYINQYKHKQCESQQEQNCCMTKEQLISEYPDNNDREDAQRNCGLLNAPDARYFEHLYYVYKTGTWHYMSSRNNNFTNRSQKGTIIVEDKISAASFVAVIGGAVGFGAAAVIAGGSWAASGGSGGAFNTCATLKA